MPSEWLQKHVLIVKENLKEPTDSIGRRQRTHGAFFPFTFVSLIPVLVQKP